MLEYDIWLSNYILHEFIDDNDTVIADWQKDRGGLFRHGMLYFERL
jgi:hypothetical protein